MTWRLFLSVFVCGHVCVCVCAYDCTYVCLFARQPSAIPRPRLSYFHGRIPPSPTARTLCPCNGLTVEFNRGAPQPLSRAGTAAPAFPPKPFKASFSREWEEAFEWGGAGEPKRMEKKRGSSKGFEPQIASRCVPLESE